MQTRFKGFRQGHGRQSWGSLEQSQKTEKWIEMDADGQDAMESSVNMATELVMVSGFGGTRLEARERLDSLGGVED